MLNKNGCQGNEKASDRVKNTVFIPRTPGEPVPSVPLIAFADEPPFRYGVFRTAFANRAPSLNIRKAIIECIEYCVPLIIGISFRVP